MKAYGSAYFRDRAAKSAENEGETESCRDRIIKTFC